MLRCGRKGWNALIGMPRRREAAVCRFWPRIKPSHQDRNEPSDWTGESVILSDWWSRVPCGHLFNLFLQAMGSSKKCANVLWSAIKVYLTSFRFNKHFPVLPVQHFTELLDDLSQEALLGQLLSDPFLSGRGDAMDTEEELTPASPVPPHIQAEHSYSLCGDSRPQSPLSHLPGEPGSDAGKLWPECKTIF